MKIKLSPPDKGTSKDGSTRDAGETNSIYDTGFLVRLFCAVKVIRLVRFQGRQGGFMSSKAQTREKDYERGIRIADRRKAIGLSQDELAHRVGIGRQALSAIENGGDFKTQTLDNLAIVLGVSVDFIMYGKNEENSELLSEAMDVLSDMDELQIRQCLAMMKAMKRVSFEK